MNENFKNDPALNSFAEKIDFTKLVGTPEGFFKAGLSFVEKGQFDEGILEFVKVIKTTPPESEYHRLAMKELAGMGFLENDLPGTALSMNNPTSSKESEEIGRKIGPANLLGMLLVGVSLFYAFLLFSDTNGLNFINYCLPTFGFLVAGFIFLLIAKVRNK